MKRFLPALAALLIALALLPLSAQAVEPDEMLADPVLEQRAREISKGVRCVVCQNETIDDSHADLAKDLRLIVRERLVAGDSDDEVRAYLVDRYGDYVLLKTPFKAETALLWLLPALFVVFALLSVALWYRMTVVRAKPQAEGRANALSAEEKSRLDALLDEEKDSDR